MQVDTMKIDAKLKMIVVKDDGSRIIVENISSVNFILEIGSTEYTVLKTAEEIAHGVI
jgi:hypothetical protein